jgi:hypothetical protein
MMGYLRPGLSSVYHWIAGNEVASIKLHAEAGRLHLSYCVCVDDEKWKDVAEIIPIVRVPCRLGGSRTYFICPGFRFQQQKQAGDHMNIISGRALALETTGPAPSGGK